jgi:3-hydroxy-9,10-secoandrosta-1,3,5(10)-triene-9,17-dione monooxygenase reductase component
VSVVTSFDGSIPVGMTVSAFFSVSLAPPLVAVSLDRQAATLAVILANGRFAVNVLSEAQSLLSNRFATAHESIRFDGVPLHPEPTAHSPLLAGAVMHLDCALDAAHEAGDHVLCLGRVCLAQSRMGQPLLFHASRYHRLEPL